MTQLVIDGVTYPEAVGEDGTYECYPETLSRELEMISGLVVLEERGEVIRINYKYRYFDDDLMRACLNSLRKKRIAMVSYLDQDSNTLKTAKFLCTSPPRANYLMSVDGIPYWENITFSLREVRPHD